MSKRVSVWLPVVVYMAMIFYFSSLAALPGPIKPFAPYDKLLHMGEYAVLSVLFFRAWKKEKMKHALFLSIFSTVLYGISDEIHQSFVPGRVMDIWDISADAVGSFIVLLWRK